jgi:hypothetical protein
MVSVLAASSAERGSSHGRVKRVNEANASQTSYSVEQADVFQYQSYSHSDDMFIILKSA